MTGSPCSFVSSLISVLSEYSGTRRRFFEMTFLVAGRGLDDPLVIDEEGITAAAQFQGGQQFVEPHGVEGGTQNVA